MDDAFLVAVMKAILVIFVGHFVLKRYTMAREVAAPPPPGASGNSFAQEEEPAAPAAPVIVSDDIRSRMRSFLDGDDSDDSESDDDDEQPPGQVFGLKHFSPYRAVGSADAAVDPSAAVALPTPPDLSRLDAHGLGAAMEPAASMDAAGVAAFDGGSASYFELGALA